MEKKLYQNLLLAIASTGITTNEAKDILLTLIPAIFTGVCEEYNIATSDTERINDLVCFLKRYTDSALETFIDFDSEEQTFEEV